MLMTFDCIQFALEHLPEMGIQMGADLQAIPVCFGESRAFYGIFLRHDHGIIMEACKITRLKLMVIVKAMGVVAKTKGIQRIKKALGISYTCNGMYLGFKLHIGKCDGLV